MSRGTFFASSERSVLSFSCCNRAISSSVSARHLSKLLFQLLMSCILFSSLVLLSCWVQRVWFSVSFLRKRLSCRTRCEASRCLSAFVRIIVFDVCQSDTAKRGGILGSVKAIFFILVVSCSAISRKKKTLTAKEDEESMSVHSYHRSFSSYVFCSHSNIKTGEDWEQ